MHSAQVERSERNSWIPSFLFYHVTLLFYHVTLGGGGGGGLRLSGLMARELAELSAHFSVLFCLVLMLKTYG